MGESLRLLKIVTRAAYVWRVVRQKAMTLREMGKERLIFAV